WRVGSRVAAVEAQPLELARSGVGHLVAVRVAKLRTKQRTERVDVPLARRVEDMHAFAALEHEKRSRIGSKSSVSGEVQEQMLVRERVKSLRVHGGLLAAVTKKAEPRPAQRGDG